MNGDTTQRVEYYYYPDDYYYYTEDNQTQLNFSNPDDVKEYIEMHLGPQQLPLTTIGPLTIIYGLILCFGCFGNGATCLVILKNKYMQTPTNVYLANLALADLITELGGMPKLLILQ